MCRKYCRDEADGSEDDEGSITIDALNQVWEMMVVEGEDDDEDNTPLEGQDATRYRSVTTRLHYIGPDRVDVQCSTKEAARHMVTPREFQVA